MRPPAASVHSGRHSRPFAALSTPRRAEWYRVGVDNPVGCQNCVVCSDLRYLDHVRVAVVPARIWLIGGGDENRSVMSLQNASRRRGAMERTLQGKSHDTVSGTHEVLSGLVSEYRGAA